MKKNNKVKNKKYQNIIKLVTFLIIIVGTFIIMLVFVRPLLKDKKSTTTAKPTTTVNTDVPTTKPFVDVNSNSRNIAVMINNIKTVWGYQSGIQDAHIVYEIIAEGGITRLMAVFKDANTSRIGSVRSARIYYLDYALENDAIYVHIGGSKEAKDDLKTLGMTHLQSEVTFRDKSLNLRLEHTAFATMENINKQIEKRKIRNTTTQKNLLKYSQEEIDLKDKKDSIKADEVYISYSKNKSTTFKYDEEKKIYYRYQNNTPHVDYVTKEQYTAKNIITYQIKNSSYDSYGRQKLDNLGSGNGYYITNGYAALITWQKDARSKQTVYRYLNGEEIVVNNGNTYIQIQPKNRELTIR